MNKLKELYKDKTVVKYSLIITCNAALLYILYFVIKNFDIIASTAVGVAGGFLSAISPLFIGLIIAYILSPLVDIIDKKIMSKVMFKLPDDPVKLERRLGSRRFLSILITFLLIISAVVAILYFFAILIVGKFVFTGLSSVTDNVINYFITYQTKVLDWATHLPAGAFADKIQGAVTFVTSWLSSNFDVGSVFNTITGIGGGIVNLALGAIVSIYLLKDRDFFKRMWRKFLHLVLPQKGNAIITETLNDINTVLSQFIRGALLDAMIIAILSSIGLSVLGLEFSVFIGCFAGICNIIPYFGPILGMVPAFLIGMFTDGFGKGLIAVAVLLLIQQIDCNIIYPKIVGSTTGLHPLFVLLAVTVAGSYGGIVGMILAVPIAGIIQVFVIKWVNSREQKLLEKEAP